MHSISRVWVAVVAVALLASGYVAWKRIGVESRNRSVQIAVEWNEVRTLAAAIGTPPAEVLKTLRAHGAGAVAVSEVDLGDLRDAGRVFVQPASAAPFSSSAVLLVPDGMLAQQIAVQFNSRRGLGTAVPAPPRLATPPTVFRLSQAFDALKSVPVGFPPEALQAARDAGLEVIGRVGNYPGVNEAAIRWILAGVARQGVRTVVFTGLDVLGNKDLLEVTADALRASGLTYGFVEFGKQYGDAALARLMEGQVVRVHSITDPEMAKMPPPEAAERFVKAARERDIRVLYVRLVTQMKAEPLAVNTRYLDSMVSGIERAGLVIGPSHPYPPLDSSGVPLILVGAGVVAGGVLLLGRIFVLPAGAQVALFLLGVLGSSALLALPPTESLARKVFALLAAILFPTLALLVYGDGGKGRTGERENGRTGERGNGRTGNATANDNRQVGAVPVSPSPLPPFPPSPLLPLARMSLVTLIGAAFVVGLLGDTRFLVKYDQFMGIKLAHLAPILAVGVALAAGLYVPAADWAERWARARARLRALLDDPVYVWQMTALGIGLVLLAVVVMRSGNDAGMGVSPLELRFRALLDKVLWVRPRTKEFLVGHPAMVVALWAALSGRRTLWGAMLLLGAIGQVSLLNTFCHVHTPLLLSVMRGANGLIVGTLLGLLAVWVLRRILPSAATSAAPPSSGGAHEAAAPDRTAAGAPRLHIPSPPHPLTPSPPYPHTAILPPGGEGRARP